MSPRRHAKMPILIYCEGAHDQVFVRHLERSYSNRSSHIYFDIKHGDGGSPKSLVEKAFKMPGDYAQRIVIFDNDRGEDELRDAQSLASEKSIQLSYFTPCLEHVLLGILEPQKDFSSTPTVQLKRRLHANYISVNKRRDLQEYQRLYPKQLIDNARARIHELHEKISILEQ